MNRKKLFIGTVLAAVLIVSLIGFRFGPSIVEAWDKVKYEVYELRAYVIKAASSNYPLTIGSTTETVTLLGNITKSGTTESPSHGAIALLSGNTGTIAWSSTGSGNSGWNLSAANLLAYKTFLVEMSWPGSGASAYSHVCPTGAASVGVTVYLPTVTASIHNMDWEFINVQGTTPFVLYNSNGRFRFGADTGTTPFSGLTGSLGGTTTVPNGIGDSLKVKAIFTPTATSGWYVVGKSILEE